VWNTKASQLADIVERYVKKGDKIYVEGRIEYRQWQDKDGQTRYSTEINVRELIMLGAPRGGSSTSDGEGESSVPQRASRAAATQKAKAAAGGDDFEDFPGALEDEDDDLPF
jgi:single-strand DNA-binding protein